MTNYGYNYTTSELEPIALDSFTHPMTDAQVKQYIPEAQHAYYDEQRRSGATQTEAMERAIVQRVKLRQKMGV